VLRIAEVVIRSLLDLAELQHWWGEWRTRQNPVAFWLAVVVAFGLIVATVLWAYSAWKGV